MPGKDGETGAPGPPGPAVSLSAFLSNHTYHIMQIERENLLSLGFDFYVGICWRTRRTRSAGTFWFPGEWNYFSHKRSQGSHVLVVLLSEGGLFVAF